MHVVFLVVDDLAPIMLLHFGRRNAAVRDLAADRKEPASLVRDGLEESRAASKDVLLVEEESRSPSPTQLTRNQDDPTPAPSPQASLIHRMLRGTKVSSHSC